MADRDTLALLITTGIREDFSTLGKARVVHCSRSMLPRLSRILVPLAALLAGCGASAAGDMFGNEGDVASAETPDPWDSRDPTLDADAPGSEVVPPPADCPLGKDGKANICIRVNPGETKVPSISGDVTKELGIDGNGALIIGLTTAPPKAGIATWDMKAIFPSVTSGTTFRVEDLPKTAEFAVGPGSYYVWAIFKDQEPYERALAVGDYIPDPTKVIRIDVQKEDATKGVAMARDVRIYPLRAVDVDVSLKPGTKPLGNGIGPTRVRLVAKADSTSVAAEQLLPCVDFSSGKATSLRLLTTATGDAFDMQAVLFDFAGGPDDPSITGPLPPPGSLLNSIPGDARFASGSWMSNRVTISLDRTIAFTGSPPTDASLFCASYATAPAK